MKTSHDKKSTIISLIIFFGLVIFCMVGESLINKILEYLMK